MRIYYKKNHSIDWVVFEILSYKQKTLGDCSQIGGIGHANSLKTLTQKKIK